MKYEEDYKEQLSKLKGKQKEAFKAGVSWVLQKLEQIDEQL